MNELILNSLMQLFALIGIATNKTARNLHEGFFESFLRQYFSKQIIDEKLQQFAETVEELSDFSGNQEQISQKIESLCIPLNSELHLKIKC